MLVGHNESLILVINFTIFDCISVGRWYQRLKIVGFQFLRKCFHTRPFQFREGSIGVTSSERRREQHAQQAYQSALYGNAYSSPALSPAIILHARCAARRAWITGVVPGLSLFSKLTKTKQCRFDSARSLDTLSSDCYNTIPTSSIESKSS